MKTAHDDLESCRPKASRQIHSAGKLVGLDSHQAHQTPATVGLDATDDPLHRNQRVGLVVGVDLDAHALAQNPGSVCSAGQPVEARERVGRDPCLEPLNHIAVVVVVRRLDQFHLKPGRGRAARRHEGPSSTEKGMTAGDWTACGSEHRKTRVQGKRRRRFSPSARIPQSMLVPLGGSGKPRRLPRDCRLRLEPWHDPALDRPGIIPIPWLCKVAGHALRDHADCTQH